MLFCGIEKNGITTLNEVAAIVRGRPFRYSDAPDIACTSPQRGMPAMCGEGISAEDAPVPLPAIMTDSAWRRVIVYRDPVERFLSAYRSKCGQVDHDWEYHCDMVRGDRAATVMLRLRLPSVPRVRAPVPVPMVQTCSASVHVRPFSPRELTQGGASCAEVWPQPLARGGYSGGGGAAPLERLTASVAR